jgi:hypothetical protein
MHCNGMNPKHNPPTAGGMLSLLPAHQSCPYVEHQAVRQHAPVAPHDPAQARVHQPKLVPRGVDGGHILQGKVPCSQQQPESVESLKLTSVFTIHQSLFAAVCNQLSLLSTDMTGVAG